MTETAIDRPQRGRIRLYESTTARVRAFRKKHDLTKITVDVPRLLVTELKDHARHLRELSSDQRRAIEEAVDQLKWKEVGRYEYIIEHNSIRITAYMSGEYRYDKWNRRWSLKLRSKNLTIAEGNTESYRRARRLVMILMKEYLYNPDRL